VNIAVSRSFVPGWESRDEPTGEQRVEIKPGSRGSADVTANLDDATWVRVSVRYHSSEQSDERLEKASPARAIGVRKAQ
jgi:hypothetical protein